MNNIDEILDNLQKQQPVFDEEAMLDSIMESLPDRSPALEPAAKEATEPEEKAPVVPLWPRLVRNISSAAAVALLVICFWQAQDLTVAEGASTDVVAYQPDYSYYSDCKTMQEVLQRYETRKNNQSITYLKQKIYEKL